MAFYVSWTVYRSRNERNVCFVQRRWSGEISKSMLHRQGQEVRGCGGMSLDVEN